MKRYLALMTATAALMFSTPAQGHVPNTGLAAGHFSVPTSAMCPGGKNGDRCSHYGLAICYRVGNRHSVSCVRDATDRRIFSGRHVKVFWRATGSVDHHYLPHGIRLKISGLGTW